MNIVQVKSGKVELRKDSGTLIRTIVSSGAVFADLNADQTLVLVTLLNGKVELRKENSSLVRTIVSSGAVPAHLSASSKRRGSRASYLIRACHSLGIT